MMMEQTVAISTSWKKMAFVFKAQLSLALENDYYSLLLFVTKYRIGCQKWNLLKVLVKCLIEPMIELANF